MTILWVLPVLALLGLVLGQIETPVPSHCQDGAVVGMEVHYELSLRVQKPVIGAQRSTPPRCGLLNADGLERSRHNNTDEAQMGELPWMIAVVDNSDGLMRNIGGGSLIAPKVVLSAAHMLLDVAPSDLMVRAGEWDASSTAETYPHEDRNVSEILKHESFDRLTGAYNMALLFLETPFRMAPHISPICLPQAAADYAKLGCFVSGWGKMAFAVYWYPNVLKKIGVHTVAAAECQAQLRRTKLGPRFALRKSLICASGLKGKDSCSGDGGSPLVCPLASDPSRFVQAGIVNWGLGCGEENVPAIYTDVALLRPWILLQLRHRGIDASDSFSP